MIMLVVNLMEFWNKWTILILIMATNVCLSVYFEIEGFGIANSIALLSSFLSVLLALYANHKSDSRVKDQLELSEQQFEKQLEANKENLREQLIFNKKQEVMFNLGKLLEKYNSVLNKEYVEFIPDEIYMDEWDGLQFNFHEVYNPIWELRFSCDFNYFSKDLREKIDDFIVYMDKHFCEECFYRFDNLFVMLKITMLL